MAKLNKQEVNAVANKLHRELSKIAEEMIKQAIEQYVPSETYIKVKELLEKRDSIEAKSLQLCKELENVRNELSKVCPFHIYSRDSKDEVLDRILNDECKLPNVPSVDELKDEVTIAAIDDSFNTSSYIESQIEKFK